MPFASRCAALTLRLLLREDGFGIVILENLFACFAVVRLAFTVDKQQLSLPVGATVSFFESVVDTDAATHTDDYGPPVVLQDDVDWQMSRVAGHKAYFTDIADANDNHQYSAVQTIPD